MHIPVLFGLLDSAGRELASATLRPACVDPLEWREVDGSYLLHLRSPVCELVVDGLTERPILSVLRGFSAPVRLEFPRDDRELAFLAEHEADGFARWDALQTLLVADLGRRMAGEPSDGGVVELYGRLLGHALAVPAEAEPMAMLAAMLRLPDENYLYEQFSPVDVDAIGRALEELAAELARTHASEWQRLLDRTAAAGAYTPDPVAMARRALQQVALGFVLRSLDGAAGGELLERRYRAADNLTDRRAVLQEATRHVHLPAGLAARLLDDFLERWRDEALVVNQWFSLQASSPLYDAGRVAALAAHPAFDPRNPNKLRAVYGAFAQFNHRNFHARDGRGYALLADAVLALDRSNPQIAARLATPLTRWRRYDGARQQTMRRELERMAGVEGLSRDLYEVVSKGLGGTP
jgi:aminopeptidase N